MIQNGIEQGAPLEGGVSPKNNEIEQPMEQQKEVVSEDEKKKLLKMIDDIKLRLGDMNTSRFIGNNIVNEERMNYLKEVFSELQKAGVDLNDQKSVAEFIEMLKETDPESAQRFEEAMSVLLDGYPQQG